ncbi:hypothetical protein K3495_g4584 [Podosphaera aphanis]|nr:hypothetical protein K3495_g4584 [Podosphaera aphanis]
MKRVTSLLPSWDRPKTHTEKGTDQFWPYIPAKVDTQNLGKHGISQTESPHRTAEAEVFWPATFEKEIEKAARILYSFCKTGIQSENLYSPLSPTDKSSTLKRIPENVIREAIGLVIFSTTRAGLWISGAGGSGVLIARKDDGDWGPPSGILLHTPRLAFLGGVDTYDCLLIINDRSTLGLFIQLQLSLNEDMSGSTGPLTYPGDTESNESCRSEENQSSIFTYFKSHGFLACPNLEGTVIIERNDENERFYGQKIGVADIVSCKIRHLPLEIGLLMNVIRTAEGRYTMNDKRMEQLLNQPCLGDLEVQSPRSPCFGIPEAEDPDPYGVMALEKAGFEIRESGTRTRPPSSQFEYHPSPTSPVFARFNRMSIDTLASRSNRGSCISAKTRTSIDRGTQTEEIATQPDHIISPNTSPSYSSYTTRTFKSEEKSVAEPEEVDTSLVQLGRMARSSSQKVNKCLPMNIRQLRTKSCGTEPIPRKTSIAVDDSEIDEKEEGLSEFEDEDEEPVIYEASSALTTIIRPAFNARGGLVTIPKRPQPPPVPARSASRRLYQAGSSSPRRDPFESFDIRTMDRKSSDQRILSPSRMSVAPLPDLRENIFEIPPRIGNLGERKEYVNENKDSLR